jgi:hypothetical protein
MSGDGRCNETRAIAPELALGIADGEERARALDHVAACPDCRRELEALSSLADELCELAPEREPPLGFELRVLGTLEPVRPQVRRTWRRPLVLAAAAVTLVAVTAGASLLAVRDDRRLADHYRAVLAEAHGSYFGAFRLRDATGVEGGVAFVYRGSPSWVLITVPEPRRTSVARAEVVAAGGRTVPLEGFRLEEGTWGGPLPAGLGAISAVRLRAADGRAVLTAVVSPRE